MEQKPMSFPDGRGISSRDVYSQSQKNITVRISDDWNLTVAVGETVCFPI
jgi:hypothetical protein